MVSGVGDDPKKKADDGVFMVSVVGGGGGGGYDNQAYDGDLALNKPPPPIIEDEKKKIKLSRKEKWRILKNIAAVSFAFMVQFTAFQGTANLQSSINAKEGLGKSTPPLQLPWYKSCRIGTHIGITL